MKHVSAQKHLLLVKMLFKLLRGLPGPLLSESRSGFTVIDWYQWAMRVLPRIPRRILYGLCDVAAIPVVALHPALRQTVSDHLRRIAPAANPIKHMIQVWQTVALVGRNYVDLFQLPATTYAQLVSRYEYSGAEYLDLLCELGGGIMVVPHCGSWSTILAFVAQRGYPLLLVVEPVEPPELLKLVSELRQAHGVEVVALGPNVGRTIVRALKQHKIVVLAGDRGLTEQTIVLDFFGTPAALPPGPGALASRGVPVLTACTTWLAQGRYLGRVDWLGYLSRQPAETPAAATQRAAATILAQLELYIRAFPTSWGVLQPVWE